MSVLDAQNQLVLAAELSLAVLGKGADIMLIRLDGEIDHGVDALSRGYSYAGVLGVVDGQTYMLCEPGRDLTMRLARLAFMRQPKDDSEQWLWRLWSLQDTRPA